MLVSAWLMVLFHTCVWSEPATRMPVPAPWTTLEAIMLELDTSLKIAVGTLMNWEARIWELMTPSSNQMPDCRLVCQDAGVAWSVAEAE